MCFLEGDEKADLIQRGRSASYTKAGCSYASPPEHHYQGHSINIGDMSCVHGGTSWKLRHMGSYVKAPWNIWQALSTARLHTLSLSLLHSAYDAEYSVHLGTKQQQASCLLLLLWGRRSPKSGTPALRKHHTWDSYPRIKCLSITAKQTESLWEDADILHKSHACTYLYSF